MTFHPLKQVIEAADKAITEEDFDALMEFYAVDATLVIKPGLIATGKDQIYKAFVAIAEHFNHSLAVKQGEMQVIQSGNTALVIMETVLETADTASVTSCISRRATYVFREDPVGRWFCVIDNSYGTELLGAMQIEKTTTDTASALRKSASGKSTLAKELAKAPDAMILSEDTWLVHLYPDDIKTVADYV